MDYEDTLALLYEALDPRDRQQATIMGYIKRGLRNDDHLELMLAEEGLREMPASVRAGLMRQVEALAKSGVKPKDALKRLRSQKQAARPIISRKKSDEEDLPATAVQWGAKAS